MYSRYRRVVCVSGETGTMLQVWLARPDLAGRIVVIPNGIDRRRMSGVVPAEDLAVRTGFKVLMVAAFRPEKDQSTLIRALNFLPEDYRLFLAGGAETPENQALMDKCRQLVSDFGLTERVRFLGVRTDVPALLAAADVFVLSSHHEGLSLSVLEGMASGTPVVACDVEGLRDIVQDAGLLFPFGDARKLADIIRRVCEEPVFGWTIARRCEERARCFDIAETVRRHRELYVSLKPEI